MNETARRIGNIILKSFGILCAVLWIVLVLWMAFLRVQTAFTSDAPDVRPIGKIIEACIYVVLTIPGFVAIRRELLARSQPGESKIEEAENDSDD